MANTKPTTSMDKKVEVKSTAKVEAKPAAKKIEAKPAAKKIEAKPVAKKIEAKPAAKKIEAKPAAKKIEAKPAAKKTEAKKTTVKKSTKVQIQFSGKDINLEEIEKAVQTDFKARNKNKAMKVVEIYIKPEDNKAYYVVDGIMGDVAL